MLSRRDVLAGVGLAGVGLAAACSTLPAWAQPKSSAPFRVMRARAGATFAGSGGRTSGSLLGYDGNVPGPLLRTKQGEELRLRLFNELAEPTSLHWHGVRLPNAMDGVPDLTQPPLGPGASFDYRFRPPDAGTFWYHAHSSEHADRGLHGALIVEEPEPVDVDRDVALVLGMPEGAESHPRELVLVNGSVRPDIPVRSGERLRLRLINATSARGLALKLEGQAPWVMAIDGQATEPFLAREGRVGLAPGSRVDLFLDATASAGAGARLLSGLRDEYPIARLVYQAGGRAPAKPRSQPPPLPSNPLPARIDLKNALRADMTVAGAKAGGAKAGGAMAGGTMAGAPPAGDVMSWSAAPIFTVTRGRPVSLALHNPIAHPHVVHLHGHHFRLLDRLDDGWKPNRLDTLVVGELVERIAFVADNPGKWLIECRMLDRTDGGTAAWFLVT
jgi:FtsP/CotA-like multicopper oxidase with cupredoxin domain